METKERLFVNHDFVQILAESLRNIHENECEYELVAEIGSIADMITTSIVLKRPTTDTSIDFLAHFYSICTAIGSPLEEISKRFSPVITNCINSGLKNKKKVISKVLTPALSLSMSSDDLPEDIQRSLQIVFSQCIGENADIKKSIQQAQTLASSNKNTVSTISLLFSMITDSPVNRTKASQYFIDFVLTVPESAYVLLQHAVERSVKFPGKQLEDLVKETLTAPNWKLLEQVSLLDSDVIFTLSNEIFAKLDQDDKDSVVFVNTVINSYSQSREFAEFYLRWSTELINQNEIWTKESVLQELMKHLKSLSSGQFDMIFKKLLNNQQTTGEPERKKRKLEKRTDILPLLIIVKSLLSSTGRLIEANSDNLKMILTLDKELKNPLLWELKYLVLSISPSYPAYYYENCFNQLLPLSKKDGDDLWFNTIQVRFRIAEVTQVIDDEAAVSDYLKYLKSHAEASTRDLARIANRWFVLADEKFSDKQLEKLCELFLQYTSAFLKLVSNDYFYDQPRFFRQMVLTLISTMEKSPDNVFLLAKAVGYFPCELFTKQLKSCEGNLVSLLTKLEHDYYKHANKSTTADLVVTRTALANLLKRPSGGSKLEFDFSELEDFVEKRYKYYSEEMDQLSTEISENIIRYHATNFKSGNKTSEQFIQYSIERLQKLQEKKSNKLKHSWVLKLSCVVVMELLQLADFEKEGFIMATLEACGNSITPDVLAGKGRDLLEFTLLLQHIRQMVGKLKHTQQHENISVKVSELFSKSTEGLNDETNDNIHLTKISLAEESFLLLCETTTSSPLFMTSRFMFLLGLVKVTDDLYRSYVHYLKNLEREQSSYLFDTILAECFSAEYIQDEYIEAVMALYDTDASQSDTTFEIKGFTKLLSLGCENCNKFTGQSLLKFLQLLKTVLREKTWIITQYALETIFSFICTVNATTSSSTRLRDDIFVEMTLVVSSILLFHRHRINGRHHLVIRVFRSLLKCLTQQGVAWSANEQLSSASAESFSRLLSNLCEPSTLSIRERSGKNNLTSSSAQAKKELSNFVHVLLLRYVQFSLNPRFSKHNNDVLRSGFYPVFDVLGSDGQKFVSSLMDTSTRDIFKAMYEDYSKNGRWREE